MQHDKTSGFQNDKIRRSQESKMAVDAKNSKTNKISFSQEWLENYQNNRSVAEIGRIDLLPLY